MILSPYIPFSSCEICSHLADEDCAMQKYGASEDDSFLSPYSEKLEWLEPPPHDSRFIALKRCPVCETYYRYELDYEYLVNGSEDEETLTRLTPTEARKHLTKKKYEQLIENLEKELTSPLEAQRYYAAKSMATHYKAMKQTEKLNSLLDSKDEVVQRGAAIITSKS